MSGIQSQPDRLSNIVWLMPSD